FEGRRPFVLLRDGPGDNGRCRGGFSSRKKTRHSRDTQQRIPFHLSAAEMRPVRRSSGSSRRCLEKRTRCHEGKEPWRPVGLVCAVDAQDHGARLQPSHPPAASVARTCYAGPRLSSSNPRALIRLAKAHHSEVKRTEASRVAAGECGPWRQPWEEEAAQETSPGGGEINNRRR